jgi:hypothetical protein
VLSVDETPDPVGDRFQGGGFCTQAFDHDPAPAGRGNTG